MSVSSRSSEKVNTLVIELLQSPKLLVVRPCILDRAKTLRKIVPVFQGFELRLGVRGVIRYTSEITAVVSEEGFESLRRPVLHVTTPDVDIPYSAALEKPLYPSESSIVAAVKRIC